VGRGEEKLEDDFQDVSGFTRLSPVHPEIL
jgi:hypothetical protein